MANIQKLSRDQRLKMSIEEMAFSNIKWLISKNKISIFKELNSLLQNTKNHEVRNTTAKILFSLEHKTSLKAFINAIKQPRTKNNRGYLVLCCAAFDCSSYLLVFIDLVLTDAYYTTTNAIMIIEEMKGPFKTSHYNKAINKMNIFLEKNRDDEKFYLVKDLLKFLLNSSQHNLC